MLENDSMLTVACNDWLRCAAALSFRFIVTGIAWIWILPEKACDDSSRLMRHLRAAAWSIGIGVLFSVLVSLLLRELGWTSVALERAVQLLLFALGVGAGCLFAPHRLCRTVLDGAPGIPVVFAGIALVILLPTRGEWLVGGWDPGVYLNQGIAVARSGTFHPEPQSCHSLLDKEEFEVFTRGEGAYHECFPGVALDPATRDIRHYFFRLTPTYFSMLARDGGLRAANRGNMMIGLLGALLFVAFLRAASNSSSHPWFAVLLLCTQPLWIYHLLIPISEMLELFLLCLIGMLIAAREKGIAPSVLLGLAFFSAMANRISFLPVASLIVAATAWVDRSRTDRRRVLLERTVQLLAVALGMLFDLFVTDVTILRLCSEIPALVIFAIAWFGIATAVDVSFSFTWKPPNFAFPRWAVPAAVGAVVLAMAGVWVAGDHIHVLAKMSRRLTQLLPYFGPLLVASALGGATLFFGARGAPPGLQALVLASAVFTAVLLCGGFIVEVYPWATRRHVAFTVPLLANLAGYLAARWWDRGDSLRSLWRVAAISLTVVLVFANARRSWHAWNRTEYNGVSAALADVASRIAPEDIVVADHFLWGTPLSLTHGRQILDGHMLYARKDPAVTQKGLNALKRLTAQGKRIRFLTSTPKGLAVYGRPVGQVTEDWASKEVVFDVLIHGPRVKDFVLRENRYIFRLYTLNDAAGP